MTSSSGTLTPPIAISLDRFCRSGFLSEKGFTDGDPNEPVLVIRATTHCHDHDLARAALKPMETCPHLNKAYVKAMAEETSFISKYDMQERDNPSNGRYFCDNAWLEGSNANVAKSCKRSFVDLPTTDSFTLHMSYAPDRSLSANIAFDMQKSFTDHYLACYIIDVPEPSADPKSLDERCSKWVEPVFGELDSATATAVEPEATRTVALYLGDSDLTRRPGRFMSEHHWEKWVEIRNRWDQSRFVGFLADPKWPLNWNAWESKPGPNSPT